MPQASSELDDFCRAEHPRLLAGLTVYTGDRDLAAELAQEALARAARDWSRVARMDAPGGWVHRVAVNLANSSLRRRRYERAARVRAQPRAPEAWHDRRPADDGDALVREALAALPRRQREAVVLRHLLDLSVEETATWMGCADGTVRALTAQGVARLRLAPQIAQLKEPADG